MANLAGRPMREAPIDGTLIIAEVCNHSGVPETGGHSFQLMTRVGTGWSPSSNQNSHYGESSLLRWWPADTEIKTLTLTPRTNWNYQPSNGSAGDGFREEWCDRCIKERPIREDYENAVNEGLGCRILLDTMAFNIGDAQYPKEWTYAPDDVPKCTAFELDTGSQTQQPRCDRTLEMFPEQSA